MTWYQLRNKITALAIFTTIIALEVTVGNVDYPIVTNAQEISTGHLFHIEEVFGHGDGYITASAHTGRYYLIGEWPLRYYRIIEYTYRDDGQVNTYILKDEKTGEERTMRRLYGEERVMRTRAQLIERNERDLIRESFYRGGTRNP